MDQRHGHDHDGLPLHLLSLSGEPASPTIGGQRMDLNDPELVAALRAVVVQHGASFVVLDCLRECTAPARTRATT